MTILLLENWDNTDKQCTNELKITNKSTSNTTEQL